MIIGDKFMKNLKLVLIIISLVLSLCSITGCKKNQEISNKENQEIEKETVASTLAKQFKEEIKDEKDILKVANNISKNEIMAISTEVITIENNNYISGFQTEIKDYNKAVSIVPIIGTIPFVAYIFEVENAESFAENLRSNANLRWNICTEADNMEIAIENNYVFFVMSPENFDQE